MEEPLQERRCQKCSGLHVNPGPERHRGFRAAADTRVRPRWSVQGGRGQGNYPEEVHGDVMRQGASVGEVSLQTTQPSERGAIEEPPAGSPCLPTTVRDPPCPLPLPPAPSSRAPGPPTMVLTWGLQAPGEEGQRLCVTKRDLSSTSGHTCAFLKGVQRARFLITFPRLVRSEPLTLS